MNVLLMTIVVVCSAFAVTQADVDCYTCAASDNCKDPFKKDGVSTVKCPACSKTKVTGGSLKGTVVRACSPIKADKCEKPTSETEVCVCSGNLCNHGISLLPSVTIATVLGVAAFVFRRLL